MSCHGCASAFGFLNREKGCPKCGFAFCKKCLRFKLSGTLLVCKSCHDLASVNKSDNVDDPLGFRETVQVVKAIRRLESLENPAKPPIILYAETAKPRIDLLRKGLSAEDQKLVDRLANLRNTDKSKRRKSDDPAEDIAVRLAHLRGEEPGQSSSRSNIDPLQMSKTANETEDELLVRLAKEASLDKQYNDVLTSDIEERLGKLREPTRKTPSTSPSSAAQPVDDGEAIDSDMDVGKVDSDDNDDEENEEAEVQRIINQFVAEVALEAKEVYQITVKTVAGKTILLDVHPSDTIEDIKEQIEEKEGIPIDKQQLSFDGQHLNDDQIVYETIPNDSTVHLLLSLRGGAKV